jgi:hypothetical protein
MALYLMGVYLTGAAAEDAMTISNVPGDSAYDGSNDDTLSEKGY